MSRRERLDALQEQLCEINAEMRELRDTCPHENTTSNRYRCSVEGNYTVTTCHDCNQTVPTLN